MIFNIFIGLMIPFIGTSLGTALVLFVKRDLNTNVRKGLTGFAAGVMVAASIWSLIIPSIDQSSSFGRLAFIPAVIGFCIGMLFLLLLDNIIPHMHVDETIEGAKVEFNKTTMMVLAVALHNIPEGMAVGVIYAAYKSGESGISIMSALALSIGIAIQNFPEGAIVSLPLRSVGVSKSKSFAYGIISGLVEPVAGFITILLSAYIIVILPYLLAFAAGAMMYVVVEELIPEMSKGIHSNTSTLTFMIGFVLMMALDVGLG